MIRDHNFATNTAYGSLCQGNATSLLTSMANIPVQTNFWDQDQTAPMRSGSVLIASKTSFNNELVVTRRHMGRYVKKMQLMLTSMANFSVQTNIVDLDQTALRRAV